MKKAILLLSVSLIFLNDLKAISYPITPVPLRELISESEVIIIGTVVNIKPYEDKKRLGSDVAYISVKEILQGSIQDSIIKVFFLFWNDLPCTSILSKR